MTGHASFVRVSHAVAAAPASGFVQVAYCRVMAAWTPGCSASGYVDQGREMTVPVTELERLDEP
jgi:hypothetical protein